MKKDYSILIIREVYDLRIMTDLLLTFADYKGVLCSDGFDKQLYFCRVSFSSKKKRAAVADVLASNKIRFEYPDYNFNLGGAHE